MGMKRLVSGVAIVSLLAAACGGDDDESTASSPTDVSSSTSTPSTPPSSTDDPTATTDDSTATTDADTTDTTEPTAEQTTVAPPTTSDASGTLPDEVDESALALVEAGLFSIPGADLQCGVDAPSGAIGLVYAFAAEGGDLYVVCAETDDPAGGDRLRITTPSGRQVTDLQLDPEDDAGDVAAGRAIANVIATDAGGRRRVLGTVFDDGSRDQYQIPIFLGHDREAGDWTFEINGTSATADIRRPCATSGPGEQGDPTVFDPNVRFQRIGPVEFTHCRGFPDVSGRSIDDAVDLVGDHYDPQGITVDIQIAGPGCGNAVVTGSRTVVGDVEEFVINGRSAFTTLDVQLDCPTAPDLIGSGFDEATTILDGLVSEFPAFVWSADASCESGTTVAEQSPAAGLGAASIEIVRCS